jgi:hypothetical protein
VAVICEEKRRSARHNITAVEKNFDGLLDVVVT